jgi:hypothetical protein
MFPNLNKITDENCKNILLEIIQLKKRNPVMSFDFLIEFYLQESDINIGIGGIIFYEFSSWWHIVAHKH